MKRIVATVALCLLTPCEIARAQDNLPTVGDAAVQNQWFTGSLESPSPALPKAGLVALEPYAIFINTTGAYDNAGGRYGVPNETNQFESLLAFKYGITDRLSFDALPSASYVSNDQSHFTGIGDLPVELEYRFNDQNNRTGWPSVTASLGVNLPTGDYEHLSSPIDGLGAGTYMLKEGLLFQSLFDTPDDHPLRLRVYGAAYEPLDQASVSGISTYGTNVGFHGNVRPGYSAKVGIDVGYALDERWVLAIDLLENYSKGFHTTGTDAHAEIVNTRSASSRSTAVAPAVEYSWSGRVGLIAGVEFTSAGRNTSSYVSPQIALNLLF